MSYEAKVLADSIAQGVRLTTLQVTFPRIVLAEFNTHRMFSRNSASSRAIPVEKNIERILADPFIPAAFGANQKGMQSGEALSRADQEQAGEAWYDAMKQAVSHAKALSKIGVHKQWANRLLEPFAWHTVIVTATEWENFFALRCSPEAQPEIRTIAEMMREAMVASTPANLVPGEWHLPFIDDRDVSRNPPREGWERPYDKLSIENAVKLSVARCARVSYLTHDGKRDVEADIALYERLLKSGHMSPFEHAARVATRFRDTDDESADDIQFSLGLKNDPPYFVGNLHWPWIQHRKLISGEAVFRGK